MRILDYIEGRKTERAPIRTKKLIIKVGVTVSVILIAILAIYSVVAGHNRQKEKTDEWLAVARHNLQKENDEIYGLKSFTVGNAPTSISMPRGVGPLNWSIERVIERGDALRRTFKSAGGKFVEIVIKVENPTTEGQSTFLYTYFLYLVDDKGRRFGRLDNDVVDFASTEERLLPPSPGFGISIPPGIPRRFSALFETAQDSGSYILEVQIIRRDFRDAK